MPTKLKEPITFTIETVDEAVALWHRLNAGHDYLTGYYKGRKPNVRTLLFEMGTLLFNKIDRPLQEAGVDADQWEPPQPFKIGAHETTFNPNGSIKVGCTDIDRATLLEVLKRSEQAMWPKYYRSFKNGFIYRADDEKCAGHYNNKGIWHESTGEILVDYVAENPTEWGKLTRAEACAILGRDV